MASRTLGLATVMLLIGWFADPATAQNLEAGKSPAQLFSGNCSACHRSPRGLIKTVPQGSLPGFLREHYTTSRDMAATMAGYLVSSGGGDPRGGGGLTRQGQDAKSGARQQPDQAGPAQGRRPQPGQQEAARPDADGLAPPPSRRRGRNPDAPGVEATAPTSPDVGPGHRAKQKLGKRGKPPREESKPEPPKDIAKDPAKDEPKKDTASPVDAAKPDPAKPDSGETAKDTSKEAAKPDTSSPDAAKAESGKAEPGKSEQVRTEPAKPSEKPADKPSEPSGESKPDTAAVSPRHDPVPQVTPAPKSEGSKPDAPSQQDVKVPERSSPEAAATTPPQRASEAPAAAPPAPPVAAPPPPPAGPPTPPISQ